MRGWALARDRIRGRIRRRSARRCQFLSTVSDRAIAEARTSRLRQRARKRTLCEPADAIRTRLSRNPESGRMVAVTVVSFEERAAPCFSWLLSKGDAAVNRFNGFQSLPRVNRRSEPNRICAQPRKNLYEFF